MLDVLMVAAAAGVLVVVAYTNLAGFVGFGMQGMKAQKDGSTTVSRTDTASPGYDIDRIVSAHLFGQTDQPEAAEVARAPETKLQLRLMGMIASADDRYARALIGVNRGDVTPYRVGQAVEGTDARIRSVEAKRVLLDRHGAVESLYLKLPDLSSKDGAAVGAEESGQAGRQASPSSDGRTLQSEGGEATAAATGPRNADIPYGGVKEPTGKLNKLPF